MENVRDYWSKETNPINGEKFECYKGYMFAASNGHLDAEGFINSEYGAEIAKRLFRQYVYEIEPMGEEALKYAAGLGLKKEMYENDRYFSRWTIYTPLDMDAGKKYPLVFVLHGGGDGIEAAEYVAGYLEIAAEEGFIVVYPQNNNCENVVRLIDVIGEKYPIDRERIYVTGHSQGGGKTTDCAVRYPKYFAANAPCNNDVFRYRDRFGVDYTTEEIQALTDNFMPCMQIVGCCEASNIVPMNKWVGRGEKFGPDGPTEEQKEFLRLNDVWEATRSPDPRYSSETDPTRPPLNSNNPGGRVAPGADEDGDVWKVNQLNRRLATLNIEPRDIEKCLSLKDHPEDELHYVLGFYGDDERVEEYYGYKHYTVDIYNRDGIDAFRYVAVENCYHTYMLTMGRLTWEFFKKFRRDSITGKVVVDEYRK